MGRKLLMLKGSKPFFLRRGWITACLKLAGTTPDDKLLFKIDRILGPIVSKTFLNKEEGMTSPGDLVGFIWAIISLSCCREVGKKLINWLIGSTEMIKSLLTNGIWDLIPVTLPIKKIKNAKHISAEGISDGVATGWSTALTVEKSTLELWQFLEIMAEKLFALANLTALWYSFKQFFKIS